MPDTRAARIGHDDLTGWYRLHPKPHIANRQAETLLGRWGRPRYWPSIATILHTADRRSAA